MEGESQAAGPAGESESSVAAPSAPSESPSSTAGTSLSDDARIASDLADGIRQRLTGSTEKATEKDTTPADDDDEDDDEGADQQASRPAGQQTAEAPTDGEPSTAVVPLKGRAKLRADLAEAKQRAEQAEAQLYDVNRQLGYQTGRYSEVKPQEARAVLPDDEFQRLEYIEAHGGLSYDDQLSLETARTLRQFRQVWITESDQRIYDSKEQVKGAFLEACNAIRDEWGLKQEAINSAPTFLDLLSMIAKTAHAKGRAEVSEENARLKQDNTALSAQGAGRSARSPEMGGRSAPAGAEVPGWDASSSDQIAAGIRLRGNRSNGRVATPSRR